VGTIEPAQFAGSTQTNVLVTATRCENADLIVSCGGSTVFAAQAKSYFLAKSEIRFNWNGSCIMGASGQMPVCKPHFRPLCPTTRSAR